MLYVQFWQHEPHELRAQAQAKTKNVGFELGDAAVAEVLRRCDSLVVMSYLKTASTVVFNQPEVNRMQSLLDALRQNTTATTDTTLPRVFVAPSTEAPDDGRFDYVVADSLRALVAATNEPKPNTIVLLDLSKAVLEFFARENKAFGITPVAVTGLPKANYDAEFEMRMFEFPKASYVELLEAMASEDANNAIVGRADKSELGRSKRRDTKIEDGGGKFSQFDVSRFAASGADNAINRAMKRPAAKEDASSDTDVGALDD